ncbi:MAG: hypothetical protein KAJ72_06040, partial [Candidatus Heimdallarchaeota archaeon]|nr:hypothetical protein [Candidatus Heimdallarchaeota archaeon]
MVSRKKIVRSFVVLVTLLIQVAALSNAYDDIHGVELNDIIDISFDRYINGIQESGYDDENPFELTVNTAYINAKFVNEMIGMKVGEVKPSIKWTVDEGGGIFTEYEYVNTKIIRIVKDSTPPTSPIGQIILTIFEVFLVIGAVVGAVFLYIKVIHPRFLSKKCLTCGNQATSKCSKCGRYICSESTVKGCQSCGSQKYI